MLKIQEADFQGTVIEYADLFGWAVAHFRKAQTAKGWRTPVAADGKGFPDLLLVRERVIYAEIKRDDGQLTLEQRQWRDWLLAAGQEYYTWRPRDWEEIMTILRERRS